MSATLFGTRWPRRGSAASRATVTMADQCVASGSNFAVGIVVARISGPTGLGAFALAYTVWILLTTLHRSLITDPMAIMGDMRGDEKDEFVRRGFAADVTLGVMAACIIAAVGSALLVVGQHTFGVGLLSVAPWVVMLDLQDYWRWIGFMQGKPKKSLMNDLLFNAVQALAFGVVFLADLHSVFAVVAAWGIGAAVAADLRSPAILGTPFSTRRSSISVVSLAHQSVVGQRACCQLGGDPALPHSCRRHFGPGGPRGPEGGAGTRGRPDDTGDQCQRQLRPARGDQAACRPRLDGDDEGVPFRHGGRAHRFCRLRHRHPSSQRPRSCICCTAPSSSSTPRAPGCSQSRSPLRLRRRADHHLDGDTSGPAALRPPAGEDGFRRRGGESCSPSPTESKAPPQHTW